MELIMRVAGFQPLGYLSVYLASQPGRYKHATHAGIHQLHLAGCFPWLFVHDPSREHQEHEEEECQKGLRQCDLGM